MPEQSVKNTAAGAAKYAEPLKQLKSKPTTTDRNPDRRLRIGYVSPDLRRQHPVGRFLLPLLALAHHDKNGVEVFALFIPNRMSLMK